ncbi:glutathione S-transferase [Imbroritus primus]|uniref:Glutathione S-transferase n=1 Tax=Imbroritus primus TaxID=3058603 RepID=A0ACD3SQ69_9BURK|nr:glutathione S-transferase [Burkholderiaceae bacterium PBA]
MLQLCGFSASNYYNKVKLAMLVKDVPFEEKLVWVDQTDAEASPLGKVPYLITPQGPLSESGVIMEYLEDRFPQSPLLPIDPYAAAKVRELVTYLELHLELVVRELYAEAFFGGKVSDNLKARQKRLVERNVAAFAKLTKFSPYLAGDMFTVADCAAIVHFPVISNACKIIYGEDPLADLPVGDYLKCMGELPAVQKVKADRKANNEAMMARARAR